MKFKSSNQRKAVMAKLRFTPGARVMLKSPHKKSFAPAGTPLKKFKNSSLLVKGVVIKPAWGVKSNWVLVDYDNSKKFFMEKKKDLVIISNPKKGDNVSKYIFKDNT